MKITKILYIVFGDDIYDISMMENVSYGVAVLALVLVGIFKISVFWFVLGAALIGILYNQVKAGAKK